MRQGDFIINGNSKHGFRLLDRPEFSGFERDCYQEHVLGFNGDIVDDFNSFKNKEVTLRFYKPANTLEEQVANELAINNLFSNLGYSKFIFWYDPKRYRYLKMVSTPVFIYKDTPKHVNHFEVTFSVQPLRYDDEISPIVLSRNGVITNPYALESFPLLDVYGNGDIRFSFNGEPFELRNVRRKITIDTKIYKAYRDEFNMNSCVKSLDYPTLKPGRNIITWTGNVTRLEVWGRFNTL